MAARWTGTAQRRAGVDRDSAPAHKFRASARPEAHRATSLRLLGLRPQLFLGVL